MEHRYVAAELYPDPLAVRRADTFIRSNVGLFYPREVGTAATLGRAAAVLATVGLDLDEPD